jgi:hypothetical protein
MLDLESRIRALERQNQELLRLVERLLACEARPAPGPVYLLGRLKSPLRNDKKPVKAEVVWVDHEGDIQSTGVILQEVWNFFIESTTKQAPKDSLVRIEKDSRSGVYLATQGSRCLEAKTEDPPSPAQNSTAAADPDPTPLFDPDPLAGFAAIV